MTVKKLISLLETLDPEESIVFQFLIAEHTDYFVSQFEAIADYLEVSNSFGDHTAGVLKQWCIDAEYALEEQEN